MSQDEQHFQCRLRRGTSEQTAWIARRGAHVGSRVELMPSRELWDVVEVFEPGLSPEGLKELKLLNRNSLPSIEGM